MLVWLLPVNNDKLIAKLTFHYWLHDACEIVVDGREVGMIGIEQPYGKCGGSLKCLQQADYGACTFRG